ncbi:hypothetical protein [Streptomyces sp. H27-H5]|uniref:hypothetical protein n=1 Tax=Streptomyces sp. H27-H5 TaxID=2996460 RepID=UPI00226EA97F|nr:hypothetical protein [Streptomyces sp. H27-H5]MCY0957738.1 hypothetical protein [Streptomyces sp. H27-H5]
MSTEGSATPKPPCFGPSPAGVTDLTLTGYAFTSIEAGDAQHKELGAFSVAPVGLGVGTTLGVGGMYYPGPTAPTSGVPCGGGRNVSFAWTGTPIQSLTFSYGNLTHPATPIAGAWLALSAPSLGGIISWSAAMSTGRLLPGERVISEVLPGNRFAILQHVSGPSNTNAPFVSPAGCLPYAQAIGVHSGSVSTTDYPLVFRVDFFEGAS